MATETHIQDFLHSKKGEREDDDVVLSEIMEEKVTEFNGNKMKELEKSNEVVESVNTEKETEGGNFFQALSDPVVIAADDEDSTTPESCKAATTEDQEERGSTMIEGSKEELQDKSVESQEERVEYEDEVKKHSDISNVEINEKPTTFLSKNEDQERKENVVTSSQDGTFEGNESEVVKTKEECIREDNEDTTLKKDIIKEELESLKIDPQEDKREQESTESVNKTVQTYSELKQEEGTEVLQPSIETEEKTEHLHTVTTDDCIKSEKESQVELKEEVKENEVYVSEKVEDFITSEDAKCEDIKESTIGQRGTTMASFAEEPEEKSIDAQEARELIVETTENEEKARVNDDGQTEKSESLLVKEVSEVKVSERAESELNENEIVSKEEIQEKEKSVKMSEEEEKTIDPQEASGKCEEIVTKIVQSSSEIEQEEDIEETKPSVEKGQQVCEEEEKYYDTETTMKEVSEETVSEKVEGLKFYDSLDITLNEKVEDEVKEQEVYAARDGGEDVTSSTPREILNDKSSDVQEASEQYESGVNEKIEQVPEEENVNENEEIKPSVETYEKEEVKIIGNEEDVIEKFQFEGVELSNKDDEQEHIILEEDQGKDDVTCLQDPISIQEDLPKTKYDGEGKEPEFVEPRGYIEEDTKEIKSSPEIKDDIKIGEEGAKGMETFKDEYQEKDKVESVNVIENKEEIKPSVETYETKEHEEIPRHEKEMIETRENTEEVLYSVETKEMEENIEKEAIINDYGQTNTSESPLVEDVCEVIGSENVESEEGIKDFESSSRALNPDEIVMKEENQEKEQEPEEVKETMIGQHVNTVVDFEAGKDQSEMTKETLKEEAADKSSDAHEASGQYESEANEKIEQKPEEESIDKYENSEEIKPSVETYETKEQVKTKCNKEDVSENVKLEGVEHSDKYENQERIISEEGKDDVTCLQDAISIQEDLPKTIYDGEGKEPEFVKPREFIEEDTKEIKPSVETEQQEVLHVVTTDKCITPQTESQVGNEVKSGEPIQSGDDEKENVDNSTDSEKVEYGEEVKEVMSKIENEEKEQEVYMSGKDQGGEDVKEPIFGQHVTTVAYLEEEQALSSISKEETVKIDEKNKESIESNDNDGQMEKTLIPLVNEVYEETSKEVCDETISKNIESKEGVKSLETFKDEDQEINKVESVNIIENIEEIKPSMETYELKEEKEITRRETDVIEARENIDEDIEEVIDSIETKEMEEKIEEETIVDDYGQTKTSEIPLVKEVCEVMGSEDVVESEEGRKDFESSNRALNQDEMVMKEENQEKDEEPEEVKETTTGQHVSTVVDVEERQDQSEITKEILNEEAEDKSSDADEDKNKQNHEESFNESLQPCSEIKQEEDIVDIVKIDNPIQIDDGQKENVNGSLVNEVRKETDSQKVEYSEEVKETVNENENGSKVEDEEKEQEVFMSEEGHALNSMPKEETTKTEEKNEECIEMDDGQMEKTLIPSVKEVYEETSSKNVEYEEGVKALQTFKDQDQDKDNVTNSQVVGLEEDEGKEFEVVKTREIMEEEDMEEIRSSVETTEDTDVITIDACRLTEKDTKEEAMENEEKIEEETIVNEDGQNGKFESPLVKEVCEVTSSEKVESVLNENKIVIKEENEEKEHELKMSEVVQGGVDDVTSSQDVTCEDTKESTIGQHESALTKEVLMEEAKDKSIDAQEVNEEYDQNEEKDRTEESANIILHSGSEIEIPSVEIDENKQREVSEKDLQVNEHEFVEKGENMKEEDNEDVIKTHIDTEEKVEQEETTETTEEKNKEPITAHVKEIEAFKDEDQVNMSTQGQSEDYVANSHVAGIEEDLQIKKYQEEEKEPELVEKNGESKEEENTKEIKSSVETIETLENEEKIEEEEAIVNDDGQTEKSESLLVKEVSEVTISKKAESELNENEQKVKMSEEVKDCEDDDITSQNTSSEDIKETKDSSEISKDVILTKEIEQVPLETEKEKETNDLKEQIVEKDSHSIEDQKANVISEIDESPKQALESVCDVQTPEVILTSNEKELSDEVLLELDQPKEQTVDEITKKDENISHKNDNYDAKTEEEKCFQDETIRESESVEEHNDGLNEASKEKSVELKETPAATYGDEEKETISKDFSIDENLGLQEGLKAASESVIEEDQVKETKHESERSDITYENIIKHTSEKDLADGKRDMEEDVTIAPEKTQMFNTENQNETIKNVILIDEVAVDTEKETENNVKDSPTELDNTSTSTVNQKELSDEIEYSKAVPAVNNEVKAQSPTEVENIQAPETTPKMEKKEEVREATNDTCETLTDGSLSEKKLESMVPPDQELTSSTIEDQTNEVGLETENTKVDHISISNKDQNLEFTNKEFPDTLVTEEKEDENKEKFEVFETLPENVTEASFTEKNEPKTTTNEKCTSEVDVKDVEKHEKAFDYTTGGVVVNDISKKEAGLESINQDNYQSELKKEADEKIEREIPTEKEPKEFDAYVTKDTTGIDELEISQKNKTDDQVKISQTHPEVQKYEPQSSSEVFTEEKKTSDEKTKGNSEVAEHLTEEREKCLKEETGEKGAKTEEENEEEEEDDDEDNQTNDAPVMVEASKDIEVKAHKKSHNILSGVGSKVKHSYAKVKKAITGKSSSPKASSPKEKDHMVT